jgi:hypothetical protein
MKRCWTTGALHLDPDVVGKLSTFADDALPNEAGGILLGWYAGDDIHVVDAITVEDPNASPTSYRRRNDAGNTALATYLEPLSPADPKGYVGEWHSHPAPDGPSPIDKLAFFSIIAAAQRTLVLVVLSRRGDRWEPTIQMAGVRRRVWRRTKGQP